MEKEKFEEIVENLFLIPPLFKKKLIKHDLYKEDINLSPSHFHILFALHGMGTMATSELGKVLHISKPNITPLVQKLINKGMVKRITNDNDRRYIYIGLTEKGEEFLIRHKKLALQDLKKKICGLSEEELEVLFVSLHNFKEIIMKFE